MDVSDWVSSMGGPLVVVPVSALREWQGCTPQGRILGGGEVADDYDRACAVEELAGPVPVGGKGPQALVLGEEPATTCFLPEHRAFVRWLAADSEDELIAAARAVLDDSATSWVDCGTWVTDGPAMLLDSANAGSDLDSLGPEKAAVDLPAGNWAVRAIHTQVDDETWVGVVRLASE
ncbi:Imm21 family immunity protein [Actinoplanes sp. NBRC 103695]|uniref:Imm21 family immunity protein n=1 Tax=Actinoplanes sp. NBRC 103695 TaxID=3032202 RepID=UPI0024A3EDAA|nr:Imm21 family immunity protein [Actinoplanes sp. NBRC 103695]GLY98708.1 hypothetical protein Acsp02_59620 [Actinoplanes sp. NBRC 103695]